MSEEAAASTELLAAARDAAARNTDLYALLGLDAPADDQQSSETPPTTITRETVQRAWRKRSLKYHPDKAGAAGFDKAKWEEFGLARDVLGSREARAAYDGARAAAARTRREREVMSARQRRFAEELERAEGRVERRREDEEERVRENERLAREGRRVLDERRRMMREAEERERAREAREDERRDERIRELEEKIAEKARRRAERRVRKTRSKRSGGVGYDDDFDDAGDVEVLSSRPVAAEPEVKPAAAAAAERQRATAPVPAVDVQMSDDPVAFWEAQWPKTKARLLAAQATKEHRRNEMRMAA